MTRPLKIFTWHVHGSYLFNLVQAPHTFYVPVKPGKPEGYGGRSGNFAWPPNLVEVPADRVKDLDFDLVLYQSTRNYLTDQYEILSDAQRQLPRIYLEHNTPRPNPTDTRHPADAADVLLVHCTYFNAVMWDNGRAPTMVIPHGVIVPRNLKWNGELERGITVVNGLSRRGRLAGADVFFRLRREVPLDLAGMDSERFGGLGDLPHQQLHAAETRYRFFFNPIRYTSLPLSVVEAMALGLPIVALATTELPRAVSHGIAGFVSNDLDELRDGMQRLIADPGLARKMGTQAQIVARDEFGIDRFVRDWNRAFERVLEGV
jgi:hypothetical protein